MKDPMFRWCCHVSGFLTQSHLILAKSFSTTCSFFSSAPLGSSMMGTNSKSPVQTAWKAFALNARSLWVYCKRKSLLLHINYCVKFDDCTGNLINSVFHPSFSVGTSAPESVMWAVPIVEEREWPRLPETGSGWIPAWQRHQWVHLYTSVILLKHTMATCHHYHHHL